MSGARKSGSDKSPDFGADNGAAECRAAETPGLTVPQLLRVLAAGGMPVTLSARTLRDLARALDQAEQFGADADAAYGVALRRLRQALAILGVSVLIAAAPLVFDLVARGLW